MRVDNIRGSINGSDIMKTLSGIKNEPNNFEELFAIHAEIGFEGNLARLVEATNNISPNGIKYVVSPQAKEIKYTPFPSTTVATAPSVTFGSRSNSLKGCR